MHSVRALTVLITDLFCFYFFLVASADTIRPKDSSFQIEKHFCQLYPDQHADSTWCLEDKSQSNCSQFRLSDYSDHDFRSILYLQSRGRLGNQMLNYAMLAQLADELNTQPFINSWTRSILLNVFTPESIQIPLLEDTFCNAESIPFEAYRGTMHSLLTDPAYHTGRILWLFAPRSDQPDLGGQWLADNENAEFLNRVSRSYPARFQIRPDILARAEGILAELAKRVVRKNVNEPINFVGVHNRRTDFLGFGGIKPLKRSYFVDAMDHFRQDYDNVAFLYVSDDMDWGRKMLQQQSAQHNDLFFVGHGQQGPNGPLDNWYSREAAVDFALLTLCNHTIISHGTFSSAVANFITGEIYTSRSGSILKSDFARTLLNN